jgi:addiction module RelB/DinJ family antitoxin
LYALGQQKESIMLATKSSVMQFRMDTELKKEAEMLFRELGTSFAEALRIFARQCVLTRSMPIAITLPRHETACGAFAQYADPAKRKLEEGAFARAMEAKHANAH